MALGQTAPPGSAWKIEEFKRPLNCESIGKYGVSPMIVATGLAIFVVICLLLSMVQTPPDIGR